MKKIKEGKFEVLASKKDAIDRFMMLEGGVRDFRDRNGGAMGFYCNKYGKILIQCQQGRREMEKNNSSSNILTKLYGTIKQYDNKTYVEYYTALKNSNVLTSIGLYLFGIICCIFLLIRYILFFLPIIIFLFYFIINMIKQINSILEEKTNPNIDSDILIKILENKINTVNDWEK